MGWNPHCPLNFWWNRYKLQWDRVLQTIMSKKITFDKRNKKRALKPGMMVMIQYARKLKFQGKFDAMWLGPYLVWEAFPNNSLQLETLNGASFPTCMSGIYGCSAMNLKFERNLPSRKNFWIIRHWELFMWAQIQCPHVFLTVKTVKDLRVCGY